MSLSARVAMVTQEDERNGKTPPCIEEDEVVVFDIAAYLHVVLLV